MITTAYRSQDSEARRVYQPASEVHLSGTFDFQFMYFLFTGASLLRVKTATINR